MLLEIGVQYDILLRNGIWIKKMTALSLLNNAITLSTTSGQQQTLDTQKDIAVIVKSTLIGI